MPKYFNGSLMQITHNQHQQSLVHQDHVAFREMQEIPEFVGQEDQQDSLGHAGNQVYADLQALWDLQDSVELQVNVENVDVQVGSVPFQ